MKLLPLSCLAGILLAINAEAQGNSGNPPGNNGNNGQNNSMAVTDPQIVDMGPNHRIWQWSTYEETFNGQPMPRVHKYTELAGGLNYQNAKGEWIPSQEKIEAFANGAIARQGQYQVIFANNLNSPAAVDMQTPDGKRVRSNVLGLMYSDPSTGQAVVIAELQDSEGELISDNQIVYPNAFNGVKATVLYTYHRDGMEQDIILEEQPPSPEVYGMNPDTTELEVFTEFHDPAYNTGANGEGDESIGWGTTCLGHGKAFYLGGDDAPVSVSKRYTTIKGRHFLLESVHLKEVQQSLSKLPSQASISRKFPVMMANNLSFPASPAKNTISRPMRFASAAVSSKGYVLDYTTLNASFTNYTFQGDTTYYISGSVTVFGTATFEPGTVIKYATNGSITITPGSVGAQINLKGDVFRPVFFTAKDDGSIGESVGSSSPSGNVYGNPMLTLVSVAGVQQISGLHVSYAKTGIYLSGSSARIYDAQFVNCQTGLQVGGGTAWVNNALFAKSTNDCSFVSGGTFSGQNITFGDSTTLAAGPSSQQGCYLYLTNCILANVSTPVTGFFVSTNGNYNGYYNAPAVPSFGAISFSNSSNPFQVAGAGSYYLTNGCNFLNQGTTNIDSALLADLRKKTTFPPMVYSNSTISATTTFSQSALRDSSGNPSLGYHYDPLDYIFGGAHINSNLTFTAGTSVAWFELNGSHSGNAYGMNLNTGVSVTFAGTVISPCAFSSFSMVQENRIGVWEAVTGWPGGIADGGNYDPSHPSLVVAAFTRFVHAAGQSPYMRDGTSGQPLAVQVKNSEFYGGFGGYNLLSACTNCLFYRASLEMYTSELFPYQIAVNCTFYGGKVTFVHWESAAPYWYSLLRNCTFSGTTFAIDDPFGVNTAYADYNYNAFLQGAAQPPSEGANTYTVTNFNWKTGCFGDFYLPTNSPLINAGNTTADRVALYHFTTQTNQVKETNSVVDIGYHYVAVDGAGNPMDTNGDGVPDYVEDTNENGLYDAGDLWNWYLTGDGGPDQSGYVNATQPVSIYVATPNNANKQ